MTEQNALANIAQGDTAIVVVNLLVDMIERAKPFPMPPEYDEILGRTVGFIRSAREAGFPIIFIQDQHRLGDKEFSDFSVGQPHAIRGTEGAELVEQLQPLGDGDYRVGKRRFSAFFGTDMDLYLREERIQRVVLVGRPTNVCALYTAADAFMRRYEVIAISDCLYSKTGEMHERALREFSDTLGPVMTSAEFLAEPKGKRPSAMMLSPSSAKYGSGPRDAALRKSPLRSTASEAVGRTASSKASFRTLQQEPATDQAQLAVLVVNVNKDLVLHNLPEDGSRLAGRLGNVQELLRFAREKGFPVVYVMDAHLPDDWEFRVRQPHGIDGTEGAEVADEIAPQSGDVVFVKRAYDAFYETGLDPWLREKGITRLAIVGGPTNVDLRHTVVSAYNYRYAPIVIKDCTEASTEELTVESLQDMFFCWRVALDKFVEWIEAK